MQPLEWNGDIRWVEVYNAGLSTIPAFGLMRITGVDADTGVFSVATPNADHQEVLINSMFAIAVDNYGHATRETPVHAIYESGDGTPAAGETWGAGNASYKLRKDKRGFKVVGTFDGRASVTRQTNEAYITGITVAAVDGNPSYTLNTTVQFDEADGFVITNPSAGVARIDQTAASGTTVGYVNLSNQYLGAGVKAVDAILLGETPGSLVAGTILKDSDVGTGLLVTDVGGVSTTTVAALGYTISDDGNTTDLADQYLHLTAYPANSSKNVFEFLYKAPADPALYTFLRIGLWNTNTQNPPNIEGLAVYCPASYSGSTFSGGFYSPEYWAITDDVTFAASRGLTATILGVQFTKGLHTGGSVAQTGTGSTVVVSAGPTITNAIINASADNQTAITLNAFSGSQTNPLLDADGSGISGQGYFYTTKSSAPTISSGPSIQGPYLS